MTDVAELKRLIEAATPGPWQRSAVTNKARVYIYGPVQLLSGGGEQHLIGTADEQNAALIAAAVNALPDLLAENERLRAAEANLKAEMVARVEGLKRVISRGPSCATDSTYNRAVFDALAVIKQEGGDV